MHLLAENLVYIIPKVARRCRANRTQSLYPTNPEKPLIQTVSTKHEESGLKAFLSAGLIQLRNKV